MKRKVDLLDDVSRVFWWNKHTRKRIVVNQGGTYSGKTYSILQVLLSRAIEEPGARILVTAADFPRLEGDCLSVFRKLISTDKISPLFIDISLVQGPYRMINGSEFTFRTFDNREKAKGPKRDYLYVNEASGFSWDIFLELDTRVEKQTYIDYNPSQRFWAHDKLFMRDDCQVFISTFMDNPFCPEDIKRKILGWYESYLKTGNLEDLNQYRVYGQGKTGIVQGVVIPQWTMISNFPDPYYLRSSQDGTHQVYWLDFGYTSDPTSIGRIGFRSENNRIVAHQLFYQTDYNSHDLPELFPELGIQKGKDIIVADSANLEAIDLLARHGYRMVAAKKDPGSVKAGIEAIKKNGLDVTQTSTDLQEELKRYIYKRTNGVINKDIPIDAWNHCIDGIRYAVMYFLYGWGEMRSGKISKVQKPRRAYSY